MKILNYNNYKHDQKEGSGPRYNNRDSRVFYREYLKTHFEIDSVSGKRIKLSGFKHPLWSIVSNREKWNLHKDYIHEEGIEFFDNNSDTFNNYLDHVIDTNSKYKDFKMNQRDKDLNRLLI